MKASQNLNNGYLDNTIDKKICILMAAYNGSKFIEEQIKSIQLQSHDDWVLYVNIDLSDDNTKDIVLKLCAKDSRIILLKHNERFGSAGKNFYDLLKYAPISQFKFIAFADQDDIWHENKLSRGLEILSSGDYHGYSSSITAFYSSGKKVFIKKSNPQKLIDYKFESGGPGCTYMFKSSIADLARRHLLEYPIIEKNFYYHDWLVYYACRNSGYKWYIDDLSYMNYRQHDKNDTGANVGFLSATKRLKLFYSGWYFDQVYLLESTISKKFPLENYLGKRDGLRFKWIWRFSNTRRVKLHALILGFCAFFRIIK